MKCKVCGNEIAPGKSFCDKCGSPYASDPDTDSLDFAWDTKDFPKPKKPLDIEMHWPGMEPDRKPFMKQDASEGFVSVPTEKEEDRINHDKSEYIGFKGFTEASQQSAQSQAPQQPVQPQPAAAPANMSWTFSQPYTLPQQQPVYVPPYYTAPVQPVVQPVVQPTYAVGPISYTQAMQMAPMQPAIAVAPAQSFTVPQVVAAPAMQTQPFGTTMPYPQPQYVPAQTAPAPQQNIVAPAAQKAWQQPQFSQDEFVPPKPQHVAPQRRFTQDDINADENGEDFNAWLDSQTGLPESPRTVERSYSTSKKNEEFQRLLDQEYARYRAGLGNKSALLGDDSESSSPKKYPGVKIDDSLDDEVKKEKAGKNVFDQIFERGTDSDETRVMSRGNLDKTLVIGGQKTAEPAEDDPFSNLENTEFERMMMDGTKDPEEIGEDTIVLHKTKLKSEISKQQSLAEAVENNDPRAEDILNNRKRKLADMARARDAYFGAMKALTDENDIELEIDGEEAPKPESTKPEAPKKDESVFDPKAFMSETPKIEDKPVESFEDLFERTEKEHESQSISAFEAAFNAGAEEKNETDAGAVTSPQSIENTETIETSFNDDRFTSGFEMPPYAPTIPDFAKTETLDTQEPEEDINQRLEQMKEEELKAMNEKEGRRHKGFFGRFVGILLLIIVLAALADAACLNFLPEGPVTEFFEMINGRFVDFGKSIVEIIDLFKAL